MLWPMIAVMTAIAVVPYQRRKKLRDLAGSVGGYARAQLAGFDRWLSVAFAACCVIVLVPFAASAGPIEDFIVAVFPGAQGSAWLAELGAFVVAGAAFLAAVLPKGDNIVRRVLDWLALNVGNAKNEP